MCTSVREYVCRGKLVEGECSLYRWYGNTVCISGRGTRFVSVVGEYGLYRKISGKGIQFVQVLGEYGL